MTNKVMIIPFPNSPRPARAAPDRDAGPAAVYAFPLNRDHRMVLGIADEMKSKPSEAAAEHALGSHLEIEAYRLDRAGVAFDEIERALNAFGRAAWAAYDHAEDDAGAA